FATKFANYAVNDTTRRGPVTQPKVPRTFASKISSTLGLSESPKFTPRNIRPGGMKQSDVRKAVAAKAAAAGKTPRANDVPANTCAEWYGSILDTTDPQFGTYNATPTYALCGYKPGQMRNAYGMNASIRKGNDGTGVNVAIVDAFLSPTLLKDAQTY